MKRYIFCLAAFLLSVSLVLSPTVSANAAATDVLKNKTLLVVGDDVSAGWHDVSRGYGGWGRRLQDAYKMQAVLAHSTSGLSISDWRKGTSGVIYKQITDQSQKSFDYVLLSGGMADAEPSDSKNPSALAGVALGMVKQDYTIPYDYSKMTAATFADGMERLIINAVKKYSGARIGFIIGYATPNNACENARDMERYWDIARQVCDKWDVPYLDLYAGKAADGKSYSYDILDMDNPNSGNHTNGKHLRGVGYDAITPYIAQWMTTLQPYDLAATLASAPTTTKKTGKTLPTTTTTTTDKAEAGASTTTVNSNAEITTTTSGGNKGGVIAAGDGELVTRKTTTTATAVDADASAETNDTTALVLIICVAAIALIGAGIVTTLVVLKKK